MLSIARRPTAQRRRGTRVVLLGLVLAAVVSVGSGGAWASEIKQPTSSPFAVAGGPSAFVVVASGFTPDQNVFVEQCDGVPTTAPGWSPTIDCDLGSSPSPASADPNGVVTFDGKKMFQPFQGESPQSLFNCLAARQSAPANKLRSYTNCQVRVSSNNSSATADQTFLAIALPPPGTPPPTGVVTTTSTKPGAAKVGTKPGEKAKSNALSKSGVQSKPTTTKRSGDVRTPPSNAGTASASPAIAPVPAGSRTLTGPGAIAGYVLIVSGLGIALGRRLRRRRRAA